MRAILMTLALTAVCLLGSAADPDPAECRSCVYSGTCFSDSICGHDCICIKERYRPTSGRCFWHPGSE